MTARRSSRPKRPSKPLSTANRPPRWVGGFFAPRIRPSASVRERARSFLARGGSFPCASIASGPETGPHRARKLRGNPKPRAVSRPFSPSCAATGPVVRPSYPRAQKKSAAAAGQTAAAIACVESGSSAARACAGVESRRGAGGRARAADRRESTAWRR